MQDHAEIVIIGGGIVGCSIAYHLTKRGKSDVLLLEKSGLSQGATWHAAGIVGQLRPSRNLTRMLQRSIALYEQVEKETGMTVDWRQVGSLRIASSKERIDEYKRAATIAKSFGLDLQILGPKETQALFPIMSLEGVEGAAYLASDGQVDPASVCQAIATGARKGGTKIEEGVHVTGFTVKNRRITEVETDKGTIKAEIVVNCAGMWGREIAALAGVRCPALALEHQYLVTDPVPDLPKDIPAVRDPDLISYWRFDPSGIMVGGWEPDTLPFGQDGIPPDFAQQLLPENFDRFEQIAERAAKRTPILNEVGVRQLINGPIPYSADGEFVMGRHQELDNFYVCTGFLYGIAGGPGAGEMMVEWILDGRPSLDLWPLDVRRFYPHHDTKAFMFPRAVELYGKHYTMKWPLEENESARGIRRSPLYWPLKEKGAVFGSKAGWERANWFAPEGVEPVDKPSFGRANWFEPVAEEHRAARERVAIIDLSSFAKMEVRGPKALESLQWLATANLDRPAGRSIYTQLCNEQGGIEADLTISRLDDDRFYIVTGSAFGPHDFGWINAHLPSDGSVTSHEVTSAYAVLHICGPRSRALLEKVAEANVSGNALPYAHCREIVLGAAPALAIRLSYSGELGYELHIPSEYAAHVYELLWEAGQELGLANIGYRAYDSLRMEKGYLAWAGDISPDYSPYHAGLGAFVSRKKGDFLGRAALEKIREEGPGELFCHFTLEEPANVFGGEAILRKGEVLGITTSGNFGHTVGKPIVMGYVPAEQASHTDYEVETFGEAVPATRHDEPIYDPKRERLIA
jgi:4-methylaminobutanoate oxidase (formaldehyde-forming)